MIKVFSASWCSGCKVLKKVLEQENIKFTEVDIETEEGAKEARELRIRSLPTTLVDGVFFVGSSNQTVEYIKQGVANLRDVGGEV